MADKEIEHLLDLGASSITPLPDGQEQPNLMANSHCKVRIIYNAVTSLNRLPSIGHRKRRYDVFPGNFLASANKRQATETTE